MVDDCVFGCQPSLYIQWKSSITGYWYTYVHWCVCGFDARTKNLRVSKWYLDSIIVCIGLLSTLPDIYWLLFTYLGQVESGFQTVFISICRGSHSAMSTDAPSVHRRFSDFEGFDKGHPIYIYMYMYVYIYILWIIMAYSHFLGTLSRLIVICSLLQWGSASTCEASRPTATNCIRKKLFKRWCGLCNGAKLEELMEFLGWTMVDHSGSMVNYLVILVVYPT